MEMEPCAISTRAAARCRAADRSRDRRAIRGSRRMVSQHGRRIRRYGQRARTESEQHGDSATRRLYEVSGLEERESPPAPHHPRRTIIWASSLSHSNNKVARPDQLTQPSPSATYGYRRTAHSAGDIGTVGSATPPSQSTRRPSRYRSSNPG
jgi:hypothetical protein